MREVDDALAKAFASRESSSYRDKAKAQAELQTSHLAYHPHIKVSNPSPSASLEAIRWPELLLRLERDSGRPFSQLADRLSKPGSPRTIVVTSRQRAEGRSTTALGLGRELARRSWRTLIVDADFSHPTLAKSLGLRPSTGLDALLDGDIALKDTIFEALDDRVHLLMPGGSLESPKRYPRHPRWPILLEGLRRDYDRIVIDNAPAFATTTLLGRRELVGLDAVVMVCNPALTTVRQHDRVLRWLESHGHAPAGSLEWAGFSLLERPRSEHQRVGTTQGCTKPTSD